MRSDYSTLSCIRRWDINTTPCPQKKGVKMATKKELEHEVELLNMQIKAMREVAINLYKSLNPLWGIQQGRFEPATPNQDGVLDSNDRVQVIDGILQAWNPNSLRVELDSITNVTGSGSNSWQRRYVTHALQKFEVQFGISDFPSSANGVDSPFKKYVGIASNLDNGGFAERYGSDPKTHPYHDVYKEDTGLVHDSLDRFAFPTPIEESEE